MKFGNIDLRGGEWRVSKIELSSVLETRLDWSPPLQCLTANIHPARKTESRNSQWLILSALSILQRLCLLNIEVEDSRSDLVFRQPKLHNNFILGMLF